VRKERRMGRRRRRRRRRREEKKGRCIKFVKYKKKALGLYA
jgi:hypothetical protein